MTSPLDPSAGTRRRTLSAPRILEPATPSQPVADTPEVRERQLVLWHMLINARYVGIVVLALLTLLPATGPSRLWFTLALITVVLPYNGIHDLVLRRRGVMLPTMAVGDQVLLVGALALQPSVLPGIVIVLVGVNATAAVAFGRRLATVTAALGIAGAGAVVAIAPPVNALPTTLAAAVASAFLIVIVGGMAEMERDLRLRYGELIGGIDAVVWEQLTDHPSTLYVSGGAETLLGYPASTWLEPGSWGRCVHPEDRIEARRAYRDAIRRGENLDIEYRMTASDGRVVHVHDRMRVELGDNAQPVHVRGVMLDITAAKLAEQRAGQFIDLAENIRLALFVFELTDRDDDHSLRVLAVNPAAAEITDLDATTAVGRRLSDVIRFPTDHEGVLVNLADVVRSTEPWVDERFRLNGLQNANRTYSATAFNLPGRAVGLALQDVTERTMAAEVLRRQALHDALTGLPNRVQLRERIVAAIAESKGRVALMMMDVNQFKDVNDALGHAHGDRLLVELSRRLQRTMRHADTIARLGGDEFAVLLRDLPDEEAAGLEALRIAAALEEPFQIMGITVQASAPIGIALYPDHASDPELLIQHADVAMYVAKRAGRGIATYAPELDSSSVKRLTLVAQLRRAIAEDELVLHFQPSLDLRSGQVHGAEALVRWQHPDYGLMPPGEFIELAEVSGAIAPLTRWVIDAVIAQLQRWSADHPDLQLGCNLSVRNLHDRDLVPWLAGRLHAAQIAPSRLKLEVTESELMDDPAQAMEVLSQLRALGVETSIDDFGTGYSSLAYLKNLPIDELKIDKSFVDHLATDPHDQAIVQSTIDLSHRLGLSVTAEGVEGADTLQALSSLGCDRAQGYFVSRPLPPEQFDQWLNDDAHLRELRSLLTRST